MSALRLLAFALATLLSGQATSQQEPCHEWRDEVELEGKLTEAVFPGRPNFESVARGDRPIMVPLLFVPGDVCVNEDASSPFTPAATTPVLQVLYKGDAPANVRDLIGSIVTVRGMLWFPYSGFHRTAIMIIATSIESRSD